MVWSEMSGKCTRELSEAFGLSKQALEFKHGGRCSNAPPLRTRLRWTRTVAAAENMSISAKEVSAVTLDDSPAVRWCVERMIARGADPGKRANVMKQIQALLVHYSCSEVKQGLSTVKREEKYRRGQERYRDFVVEGFFGWMETCMHIEVPAWLTKDALGKTKTTDKGEYC